MPSLYLFFTISLTSLVIAKRSGGSFGRSGGSFGRSGGSHYPASNGLSGTNTHSRGNYQSSNTGHTYPQSTGLSGNTQRSQSTNYGQRTEVHHHYHYSPPQQISYGSQTHPVYHGTPPVYVYEYRNSGSRFDNLLTGLALYNLGRMSASHDHHSYSREYRGTPGETCKLGIYKNTGEYEETRIDCKLISSFIWDSEREKNKETSSTITKTVLTQTSNSDNSTITTQNTTVVEALQVKGPSIAVSPGMNCYMIRVSRDSSMKRKVDCGLLQEYATRSLRYNRCPRAVPVLSIFFTILITFL